MYMDIINYETKVGLSLVCNSTEKIIQTGNNETKRPRWLMIYNMTFWIVRTMVT